ncbi:ArsR/SmtB family transcription factor [Bacillus sp. CGMCC 1.16607]|uniref:ArsR/SmtB family transcription factor n=1 Tax=Bacillus sp. CGMCC 1.16607 TaxID=3351842 RepID=UPI00362A766E
MTNDFYEINSYEQMKSLTHPLRRKIFNCLEEGIPRTSQQLSLLLNEPRNKVHYHMKDLEKTGLIILVDKKVKGGFEEKYYLPVANKIVYNLKEDISENIEGTRYELDKLILEEKKQAYLAALKQHQLSPQQHQNPFIMGLKKDLSETQQKELQADLETFLSKWFEVTNIEEEQTNLWEITITVNPVK